MKRDFDLIRKILIAMEEHEHGMAPDNFEITDYTEEQIGYHVHLMGQAGLLVVADSTTFDDESPSAVPISMTWAGHDFLGAVKDDGLWSKAKEKAIKPAGGIAFGLLLEWLKQEGLRRLGLS